MCVRERRNEEHESEQHARQSGRTASTATATLGLGFIDTQGPSVDFDAVHFFARHFGSGRGHGDKAEPPDFSRITVRGHEAVLDGAVLFEFGPNVGFDCVEGKVADVKLDVFASGHVESSGSSGSTRRRRTALGTRFVDPNGASVEFGVVHLFNGGLGRGAGGHGHETKATRSVGSAFQWQKDVGDFAKRSKGFAQTGFIGGCSSKDSVVSV